MLIESSHNFAARFADEEASARARGGDRGAGLQAARDAFYKGDIARMIVAFHREQGGWLCAEDLAGYHSPVERAPSVRFAGTQIYTCGPWCQGPVLGQTLNMLDAAGLKAAGHNSADYLHAVVEALKLVLKAQAALGNGTDPPPLAIADFEYFFDSALRRKIAITGN